MNIYAEIVTDASVRLRQIAALLVERCPAEFGQEILLIGSAGWGNADACSDIDLDFWAEQIPAYQSIRNWLLEIGVTLAGPETKVESGEGMHLIGLYRNTWVEFGWFSTAWRTKILCDLLAGENLERGAFGQAWNVVTGMPLRTQGLTGEWQRKLAGYPDALQSRLIDASTEFWQFPHHIEMLWTLAFRRTLMGLDEWLFADVQDGLRILFAANRQWEPDWKNLSAASRLLRQKPDQLCERVSRIFQIYQPEERVETTLRLLADILSLVPQPLDVSVAKKNIEWSLRNHCA